MVRKDIMFTKDSIDDIEKLTKSSDQTTSLGTLSKA